MSAPLLHHSPPAPPRRICRVCIPYDRPCIRRRHLIRALERRVHRHGRGRIGRARVRDEAHTYGGVVIVEGDTTIGGARCDNEATA